MKQLLPIIGGRTRQDPPSEALTCRRVVFTIAIRMTSACPWFYLSSLPLSLSPTPVFPFASLLLRSSSRALLSTAVLPCSPAHSPNPSVPTQPWHWRCLLKDHPFVLSCHESWPLHRRSPLHSAEPPDPVGNACKPSGPSYRHCACPLAALLSDSSASASLLTPLLPSVPWLGTLFKT